MSTTPYEPFSLSVVPARDEVILVPHGDLDLASAGELEREGRDLLGRGFNRLVVDLRAVAFLDSTGLRALLALREAAACDGRSLTLVQGPGNVQRIFELTATRELFAWRER